MIYVYRVYEGESDGLGVVHMASRDSMGEFTACRRDAIVPGFYLTKPDAVVTCLECIVRGWAAQARKKTSP